MKKVIVVGGGAAGMMAALTAAEAGHRVTLLEKNNKPGKKILITGGGRCNVTNTADPEDMLGAVVTNRKFLYSAMYGMTGEDMRDVLRRGGLETKVEARGRVFPVTDSAGDVVDTLVRLLKEAGVSVWTGCEVRAVVTEKAGAEPDGRMPGNGAADKAGDEKRVCRGVELADGRMLEADVVIVATGGLSYRGTGSTGDGLRFAREAGLEVTEARPGLVPLISDQGWVHELSGVSFTDAGIQIRAGKKTLYREQGDVLFTHFGLSGPGILNASSSAGAAMRKAFEKGEQVTVLLNVLPGQENVEEFEGKLKDAVAEHPEREVRTILSGFITKSLAEALFRVCGIPADRRASELKREERRALAEACTGLRIEVRGFQKFAHAMVTRGGVSVKAVDPSTMEAKDVKGLRFAGEVLDVDAVTGGYNLHIAWATGKVAGSTIQG